MSVEHPAVRRHREELETAQAAIKKIAFPPGVVDCDVRLGEDWNGNPSVFVTVVVGDDTWSEEWLDEFANSVRKSIRDAIWGADIDRWPYVQINTASGEMELKQMDCTS